MNIPIKAWVSAHKSKIKSKFLYGLRYSGLTLHWAAARVLEGTLHIIKRKMQDAHAWSTSTANRIWSERQQLGQEDQSTMSDQPADVEIADPDKVEELVDAEELVILSERPYETERPSEDTHVV